MISRTNNNNTGKGNNSGSSNSTGGNFNATKPLKFTEAVLVMDSISAGKSNV